MGHLSWCPTGGDFGKREISPALANRFTQIWVPAVNDVEELRAILDNRLPGARCFSQYVLVNGVLGVFVVAANAS